MLIASLTSSNLDYADNNNNAKILIIYYYYFYYYLPGTIQLCPHFMHIVKECLFEV